MVALGVFSLEQKAEGPPFFPGSRWGALELLVTGKRPDGGRSHQAALPRGKWEASTLSLKEVKENWKGGGQPSNHSGKQGV